MKKVFIGNYKGGVGKTTSTLFLGKCLKDLGKKVLLMDLDPQSSLSEICIKKEDKSEIYDGIQSYLDAGKRGEAIYRTFFMSSKEKTK